MAISNPARQHRWGTAGALLLSVSAPAAWAQEAVSLPTFSLERLELNPGHGPVLLGSGELLPPATLRLSLVGHYQRDSLEVSDSGQTLALIQDRTSGVLSVGYGVLPWLELDAQLPVVVGQGGDDLNAQGIASPAPRGVGSPRLSGRLGLLSQSSRDALDLALELGIGLPVGSSRSLSREADTSFHGRVMLGGRIGMVAPALEAGVLLRPTVSLGSGLGGAEVGSEARVGAGLTVGRALRGELAARASYAWAEGRTSWEVLGGARYAANPEVELFALGGVGFGSELGTPLFRVLAGVAFDVSLRSEPETEEIIYELVTLPPKKPVATPTVEVGEFDSTQELPAPAPETPEDTEESETDSPPLVTLTRERLVLQGQVFFETGVSKLPDSSRVLDRVAEVLLEHPEIPRVIVEGHTDTVGDSAHNQSLSLARAEAVRRYLIDRGVPARRLVARGLGNQQPAASNETAQGRDFNRRVEFLFSVGEGPPAPEPELAPPL